MQSAIIFNSTIVRGKLYNAQRLYSAKSKTSLLGSETSYCIEATRKFDHENYLSTLLLPEHCRSAVFALRAFTVELAQIKDVVSDPKTGLMRVQFWKDTVNQIYEGSYPRSPVAAELFKAVRKHSLTKRWLQRIIDARADEISVNAAFASVASAEKFFESTNSSLNYLILETVGMRNVHADHAASHIGKAQGFATLIRAVPYHIRRRNIYLPIDLMIKHKVSQEDIVRECREQKVKDLVYELASEAHKHIATAESFKKDIPTGAVVALLHAVSTRAFLQAIQRVDFDPFDPRLRRRNHWLPLRLWLSKFKKTF